MSHEAKSTTDHETIRNWAEERGGKPATVKGTGEKREEVGVLRIEFPECSDEKTLDKLEPISWDEFFQKFDEAHLAFLYQEETAEGKPSRFNKFVCPETVESR